MPASLPPGPSRSPFAQAASFHRDPLGVLRDLRARHGDVFTVRFPTARPLVVVCDPADAARLGEADGAGTHAGEARRRILPLASARSAFGADEGQHRAARARLAPAFTPEAIAAHRDAMARIAAAHVAGWPRGRPFRLLPRIRLLVDELTARLVIGVRDEARARELAHAMRHMLWTPGNPPLSPPGEGDGLMGAAGKRFAQRRMRAVQRILGEELEARRAAGGTAGDDILGCLARADPPLSTAAAIDELLPVLMAAQEPAAAALTWVLVVLAREPEVAARYAGEPPDRAFREAVVREVLRLRPPALAMLRRLTEPMTVAGHELPAGVSVVAPIVLLHREAAAFPEPDAFRPQRWMDGGPPDGSYWPFGAGARRCLGEALARAELDVVVGVVLRALRLQPGWLRPERMVLRATILVPHRSGLVVARAR